MKKKSSFFFSMSVTRVIQYVDICGISFKILYETSIYESTEKEWFANVMSKAAKNGLTNGWGMGKRVGKDEK